jgi:hypothetical protein
MSSAFEFRRPQDEDLWDPTTGRKSITTISLDHPPARSARARLGLRRLDIACRPALPIGAALDKMGYRIDINRCSPRTPVLLAGLDDQTGREKALDFFLTNPGLFESMSRDGPLTISLNADEDSRSHVLDYCRRRICHMSAASKAYG